MAHSKKTKQTIAKLFKLIQWYNLSIKSKTQKPHYMGTL